MTRRRGVRWVDLGRDSVESRPHSRSAGRSEMGRSAVYIACPFCGCEVEAFLWSLAGSGKRCPCGAMHGASGNSIAWKESADA